MGGGGFDLVGESSFMNVCLIGESGLEAMDGGGGRGNEGDGSSAGLRGRRSD